MAQQPGFDHRAELVRVINQVRSRWRTQLAVRGSVAVAGGTVIALVLAAYGLDLLRFTASSVILFRLGLFAVIAGLVVFGVVRPMRRRVTDMQVALYVEEHAPSLEAAILSAVEVVGGPGQSGHQSPALIEQLVRQAVEQCKTLDSGRLVGLARLRRHGAVLAGIAVATTLLLVFGPDVIRQGASALFVLSRSAEAASPYAIEVKPGTARVPRGSDQSVSAKLMHFTANDVTLMVRTSGEGDFDKVPLTRSTDQATFEGLLFKVAKPVEYYVESDGVRSSTYRLDPVDLPAVSKLEIEYHFPEYTGLPVQKVEGGGDVAALKGTEVRLHITPTMATSGGKLDMGDLGTVQLQTEADGTLTGSFRIDKPGFYSVALDAPTGEHVKASPDYTIDMIKDLPPRVSFVKPGRDTSATPLEEVFVEAKAEDDFGVKSLQFFYSVNGGAEKSVSLFGGEKPRNNVQAGHTIYAEELGVKPGDSISYYAKATDNDTAEPKTTTSDMFFVKIRPERQTFRAAQSNEQQGQGQGQQQGGGALSEQERQVISATFNVDRDKDKTAADKFKENTVVIALNQSKLRDQVGELQNQLMQRAAGDPAFKPIIDELPKAIDDMKLAESSLRAGKPKDALAPEQRALKVLQDAETRYEFEVRQQKGGGGGGGGQQMADDLADLFQLQKDKLSNQYETQQEAGAQADKKVDEIADKLKELAKRQEQEAQRQRRQAAAQQQAGGSGSAERDLAAQLEEQARQLDQLSREPQRSQQQRQDMQDAAKRLQDAANAARRAAAGGQQDAGGQAASALEQMKQAQQALQRSQTTDTQRAMQQVLQQAQELAAQQKDVAQQAQAAAQQTGAARDAAAQQLADAKDQMQGKVSNLQQQLNQLAGQTKSDQPNASRKLQGAASAITDSKVQDKIRDSKTAIQNGAADASKRDEQEIGANLDDVQKKVADAAAAMGQGNAADQANRLLQQAANAARGMDSLNARLQAALQGQNGQQGQGQQGEQGKGQQGQGQQGEQGKGQQGQGQQGQGQQGKSQQGQGQGQGQQGQGQGRQGQGQEGQGQGQGQQPGRQGQGQGQPNGNPQGGGTGGSPRNGVQNNGDSQPGLRPLSPEAQRQFRSEVQQRANDIQSLRQQLQQAGINTKDLDDLLQKMHALDAATAQADPKSVSVLAADSTDKMKRVELDLRKKIDTNTQQLLLNGTDEAPQNFKSLVDEYYRSLAKKGGGGGGGR